MVVAWEVVLEVELVVELVEASVEVSHQMTHIKLDQLLQGDNTIIKKIVKAPKVQLDQVAVECEQETWDQEALQIMISNSQL